MSQLTILRDKLITGLGLGTYSSDDTKRLAVDLAIENAFLAGQLAAVNARDLGRAQSIHPTTPQPTSIQLRPMSEFPSEGDKTHLVWLSETYCCTCSVASIAPTTRQHGIGWIPFPDLILPVVVPIVAVEGDDFDDSL